MRDAPALAYLSADPGISADGVKGASVHFRELGRALVQEGFVVDAFVARPPTGEDDPLPATVVPLGRLGSGPERELRLLAGQERMMEAMAARGGHVAVYERFSLFGIAGLTYARSRKIPFILEVNAPLWREAELYREFHLREAARSLSREVLGGADQVLVVSDAMGEVVREEGVPEDRIRVTPNGVNREAFTAAEPRQRPASLVGRPVLVFVGSLKAWHGVSFLLEAFDAVAAHRDAGLWIVGDGPLREEVEDASRTRSGRIVMEGRVPHGEVPSILKAADVAVAPYPAEAPDYFSPLKIIEALAAGCPVLASDTPCVRAVVGDPPLAELFAPGDAPSFAAALGRLLDDPHRRAALREDGSRRILSDHTWANRAMEIRTILGSLAP